MAYFLPGQASAAASRRSLTGHLCQPPVILTAELFEAWGGGGLNRLDRALAILLLLRGGGTWPAAALAERLEVSVRTIHRDLEVLSGLGVPVFAELGRHGGFRLMPGYFLPPVMFTEREAVSLLLGLALLGSLGAAPFAAEQETAERKVLAAVPDQLRAVLAEARRHVGFERAPGDAFHPEPDDPGGPGNPAAAALAEREAGAVTSAFLQAVLDRRAVRLHYRSPYRGAPEREITASPFGLFWDRDRWYLVGRRLGRDEPARLWRADRVADIRVEARPAEPAPGFDVRALLGRRWLAEAMADWSRECVVRLAVTPAQATRLQRDWYFRLAGYQPLLDGRVEVAFGEADRTIAFDLLRWLGPGAELLAPRDWRSAFRDELQAMLAAHTAP